MAHNYYLPIICKNMHFPEVSFQKPVRYLGKQLSTFPISPSIHMDCASISFGHTASPKLTQTYTAFLFSTVICQKGYLIIPGVLYPTPKYLCIPMTPQKRFIPFRCSAA